jgi:hypothetical protein
MYQLKLNDENYIEKHIKDFSINHLAMPMVILTD